MGTATMSPRESPVGRDLHGLQGQTNSHRAIQELHGRRMQAQLKSSKGVTVCCASMLKLYVFHLR